MSVSSTKRDRETERPKFPLNNVTVCSVKSVGFKIAEDCLRLIMRASVSAYADGGALESSNYAEREIHSTWSTAGWIPAASKKCRILELCRA